MLLNPDFLRKMDPPISDLIEFILSEEKTCQTHAMFGLQLLVESYKSFIIPKPRTATPNCRIQMLRFAQDVRSSLDHLRECQLLECIRDCKCERCLENPLPKALPELERHRRSCVVDCTICNGLSAVLLDGNNTPQEVETVPSRLNETPICSQNFWALSKTIWGKMVS